MFTFTEILSVMKHHLSCSRVCTLISTQTANPIAAIHRDDEHHLFIIIVVVVVVLSVFLFRCLIKRSDWWSIEEIAPIDHNVQIWFHRFVVTLSVLFGWWNYRRTVEVCEYNMFYEECSREFVFTGSQWFEPSVWPRAIARDAHRRGSLSS